MFQLTTVAIFDKYDGVVSPVIKKNVCSKANELFWGIFNLSFYIWSYSTCVTVKYHKLVFSKIIE